MEYLYFSMEHDDVLAFTGPELGHSATYGLRVRTKRPWHRWELGKGSGIALPSGEFYCIPNICLLNSAF